MKYALLALLLCGGAPAIGAVQTSSQTQPASEAQTLASLVLPADMLTEIEVNAARTGFLGMAKADDNAKALEAEHPGLFQYAWNALEPEFRRHSIEDQPRFRERLSALFSARLTSSELSTLNEFYASRTGQKMIVAMYTNIDFSPVLAQAIADPDSRITAETVAPLRATARDQALKSLDKEDEAVLLQLAQKIDLQKFLGVGKAVQELTLESANAPDPEFDARMEKLIIEVMRRFMAEKSAKR